MIARTAGLVATLLAVVVLLGSLIAGLMREPGEFAWDPVMTTAPGAVEIPVERVRVEVLNGAAVPGLAREVTERLRREGFDVVYYGNAGRLSRDSSTVLDRIGNPAATARVAAALGIRRVEAALDTTLYLESTVILAPDFVRD